MCSRTHPRSSSHANGLGIAGFTVSLFGLLFTLGLLCPVGLVLSFFGLFSKRRGFAIAGIVLGSIGSAMVAVGVASVVVAASAVHHYSVEVPRVEQTHEVLHVAAIEIEQYRQTHGRLPDGIEGNKLVLQYVDAYGNEVRYEPEEQNQYGIRSAGPDGEFDTTDDLRTLSYDPPASSGADGGCR